MENQALRSRALSVTPARPRTQACGLHAHEYSAELVKYAREHGHTILQKGLSAMHALGVAGDIKLIDFVGQRLGDTVADQARLWGADLVVLGTHGRRGVGRLLLGSGAEQVIRLSPVPVLVIRSA